MLDKEKLANVKVKLSSGHEIPQLGFGTWLINGEECTQAVASAIEVGYRHIDTAQTYENQKEIAPGLKKIERQTLWITSKLWRGDYTRTGVPKAVDLMLKELDIDYLDLLLIHWPDAAVPIAESLEAMQKCVDAGKVRCLGMSNSTKRHIQDCLSTGVKIVMNQVEFHPYFYQKELLDFCQSHGVAVTAYSPIAHGKVLDDPTLRKIGKKHRKSTAQVSLRWLLQHGLVIIPKSVHKKRQEENADIFDFELSQEEMEAINGLNRNQREIFPSFQEFDYV
ncbi:MAG: aldo/keto reductase [Verrucomicrobia bacterium]|nr:aldo/keto reductase [Verrucomicrobiota bacterium]